MGEYLVKLVLLYGIGGADFRGKTCCTVADLGAVLV